MYGKFYVDASYEGELLQAAGCSFTFGRESQATYNESSAGITNRSAGQFPVSINPFEDESDSTSSLLKYIQGRFDPRQNVGGADDNVMAFSYRVCLTMDPNNKVPLVAPKGYDPKDFELARRLVRAELSHNLTLSAPWDYLDYYGYEKIRPKQAKKYDACCGRSPFGIDNPGLSLGYANASSRAERDRIAAEHRYFVQGLMWFWQIDPVIPKATREKYADYGLCADEWVDNGHFPRQLYARETIRMVGDKVFTQNDRTPDCREDSIAVATWWFDIHNVQRAAVLNGAGTNATWTAWNEGLVTNKDATILPFDLPYWTILPKKAEVSNLAVTNCLSVSHVAFSAIREEPTLWALGNAAGAAAAIGSNEGLDSFHDVNIKTLQEALKNQGGRLHWPESGNCGAPRGKES